MRLCEQMKNLYHNILQAKAANKKLLAILIDPDKIDLGSVSMLSKKINASPATHIFIGGSIVESNIIDALIIQLKEEVQLPIILFPGNPSQISAKADGLLFLMLLSGRNPGYLIGHQIQAVPILDQS